MKKGKNAVKSLLKTALIAPLVYKFISNLVTNLKSDLQIAGRSVVLLCFLSMLMLSFILTIWVCLTIMYFAYLATYEFSFPMQLLIVSGTNLILLVLAAVLALKIKKDLLFPSLSRLFKL